VAHHGHGRAAAGDLRRSHDNLHRGQATRYAPRR
jgi:hypothetical protein